MTKVGLLLKWELADDWSDFDRDGAPISDKPQDWEEYLHSAEINLSEMKIVSVTIERI